MDKAVIDTDTLSELMRGVNRTVVDHARQYREMHGRLTVTAVSVMEVIGGLQRIGREDRMRQFLGELAITEVLAFDQQSAPQHWRHALDYCLAALVAWPFARSARDFRRLLQLAADLLDVMDVASVSVQRRVEQRKFPFDVVSQLSIFDHGRASEIDRLLRERRSGASHATSR